jgi:hypothetical protein
VTVGQDGSLAPDEAATCSQTENLQTLHGSLPKRHLGKGSTPGLAQRLEPGKAVIAMATHPSPNGSAGLISLSDQAAQHLLALQNAMKLTQAITVYQPGRSPRLLVRNPQPGANPRVIYAAPDQLPDGRKEWCFWWRLIDKIAQVEEVEQVAQKIALDLGVE